MTRLGNAMLAGLPADIERPGYDRAAVATGVVHLGIGAFHRAHQAPVFDAALASGDPRWGILGASLRAGAVRDQLVPQDGLYSVVECASEGDRLQVIGAVKDVYVAPEDPARLVAAMADPAVHIVTLTVTEKGYKLAADGSLDVGDPDIAADIAQPHRPRTAPGLIVAALQRRRAKGVGPFTAISCDNLASNGRLLRGAVLALADRTDPALAVWIEREGRFPATMVDRIVPATTAAALAAGAARLGVSDAGLVATEPFWQWVIEDDFAGPRPDFAALGVTLTSHIAGFETAKLRLLNGAHSSLAYLGGLAGYIYVHEALAAPGFAAFIAALWAESRTTLPPTSGLDIESYLKALSHRFGNAALPHRLAQIAIDGSQKLPPRLLAPLLARRAAGHPIDALALAIAGWMRWQSGRDDAGNAFAVDDPLAARTQATIAEAGDDAEALALAFLRLEIVPVSMAADVEVARRIAYYLDRLRSNGAGETVRSFAYAAGTGSKG